MPKLHFVVTTDVGQFNAEDRKLIRSHVMRGKNLGRIRPLGSKFRPASPEVPHDIPCPDSPRADSSSLSSSSPQSTSESSNSTTPSACSEQASAILAGSTTHIPSPRNFGSFTSAVAFADRVKPETMDIVLHCRLYRDLVGDFLS